MLENLSLPCFILSQKQRAVARGDGRQRLMRLRGGRGERGYDRSREKR